jgi:TPR repeat protein
MKHALAPWLSAGVCAAAALCFALTAFAAADDDYREGLKYYRGGDVTTAMARLRKASDAGHAPAQVLLADILDQAEMNEEAVNYYRKAAEQGNADGEFGLGNMYAGGEGVKRDPAEARKWILRAADKNHARAITTLAQAYIGGGLGLDARERDGEQARRWVTRAADNNDVPALEHLAKAYRTGSMGLSVDVKQAEALEMRANKIRGIAASRKGKK